MTPDEYSYDVCLSFAGEQRGYVEAVAAGLKARGVRTFYDDYETATLLGKDLYRHLDQVYRRLAAYCVIFISKDYATKLWTSHELQSAQARAFEMNREYLLPVRFDDTELPGLRPTIGYLDLRTVTRGHLIEIIAEKVASLPERPGRDGATSGEAAPASVRKPRSWSERGRKLTAEQISAIHPQRAARLLQEAELDHAAILLATVEPGVAADIIAAMTTSLSVAIADLIRPARVAEIMVHQSADLTALLGKALRAGEAIATCAKDFTHLGDEVSPLLIAGHSRGRHGHSRRYDNGTMSVIEKS